MTVSPAKSRTAKFFRPWVGIPLVVVLLAIALPLAYRNAQIAKVPEIGEPFDVQGFRSVTIADEDNAMVCYRQATSKLVPSFTKNVDEVFTLTTLFNDLFDPDGELNAEDLRNCLAVNEASLKLF